ncbi:MAG TPA: hypothetical protein VFI73_13525 [Candidatus Nitrosopolaris sp.]|nr:hypothetical protein [Candidatus Nitrosopolaris sp.]
MIIIRLPDDVERSKKIYNDLFKWKFDKWSSPPGSEAMPEGIESWLISTVDDKGIRLLVEAGRKDNRHNSKELKTFFDVKSIQEYCARIEQSGSKIITPKMPCRYWLFCCIYR